MDVELEQLRPAGERSHFLDRMRGEAGNAEPHAEFLRRLRHGAFPVAVERTLQCGRAEHEGQGALAAHDRAGGVDVRDAGQHVGHQVDAVEGGGVARLGDLVVGGPVDIVEHRPGQARFRKPAEILDIVAIGQAHGQLRPRAVFSESESDSGCATGAFVTGSNRA